MQSPGHCHRACTETNKHTHTQNTHTHIHTADKLQLMKADLEHKKRKANSPSSVLSVQADAAFDKRAHNVLTFGLIFKFI